MLTEDKHMFNLTIPNVSHYLKKERKFNIRPRFKVKTPFSAQELQEKIKNGLKNNNAICKGEIVHHYITLYLPREQQHYWSPQLNLTLEENQNEKGTVIRGLYAPQPHIWTMFLLFYTIIGTATFFVTIYGLTLLQLGKSADILWLVPVLVGILLTLFGVAYKGQKMGNAQIVALHIFLEETTGLYIN